ncbi:diacylglycerol O-acyltransferase 1-2-like isoform X2 [Curcuma longa]|uniref:diacylglycerol O-acyltransferase 1-2-like isoform X2 n=1 Tax=Curcuma longa TaxID=136217 RepID=UPI003D9F3C1A
MATSSDGHIQTLVRPSEPDLSSSDPLFHRRSSPSPPGTTDASPRSSSHRADESAEQSDSGTSPDSAVFRRAIAGRNREGSEEGRGNLVAPRDKENTEDQGSGSWIPAKYKYRASAPAHRWIKESPLSSDAIFKQYGLLIRAGFWFSSKSLRDWPVLMCCLTLPIFPLVAFLIEKLAWLKFISEPVVISLHLMLTTAEIVYPVYVILRCDSAVLSGFTLMFFASIVWLKLVSFAHTNYDLRTLFKSFDKEDTSTNLSSFDAEEGVSFKQSVYFMLAPTLCYQQKYPRTKCIRKGWVICQFIKLVICTGLMGFIIEQYINPIVKNSQHPLKGNLLYAIERILKLSVPTLYVWLCMFYCFFHLWLNILAELLCFGDREFYKDWWNAKTVEEYWRMWNMPVHKWMIRHIYFPCVQKGLPKGIAMLISFLVSAIFHEICVAVPCHIFKFWAFLGILFQIPLVFLTKYLQNKFRNTMVGNMIFWIFFSILGQPMCVLLYYHDVMNRKIRTD